MQRFAFAILASTASSTSLRAKPPHNLSLEELRSASTLNPRAQLARMSASRLKMPWPHDLEMFVHDPRECMHISRSLVQNGNWEPTLVRPILRAMEGRPDEAFLDIGANIGVFALSVAAAGFRTVAIEPMQYNIELLAASAMRSGLWQSLSLFKSAVAAQASESLCVAPHDKHGNMGNGQLAPLSECERRKQGSSSEPFEVVPVNTVDTLLATLPASRSSCFAALKCDVEGHELEAFRGARSVLEGPCPPCLVIVEYVPYIGPRNTSSASSHDPTPFLKEHGYACKRAEPGLHRNFRCYHRTNPRCAYLSGKPKL